MSQVLVIGAGSAGKRHLRNFHAFGCRVSAMDVRDDRLKEAAEQVPLERRYIDLDSALGEIDAFDAVVVCSPPAYHEAQTVAALGAGKPVLLEKPVSPDAAAAARIAEAVRRTGVPLLLGYTYRWWPPIQSLKERIDAGAVGRVLHVRAVMSAHLADWHPWERYQDFFMASRALGGGALLDESHILDLMLWFFGTPQAVTACVDHLSALEIDCDDNVDAWLHYADGPRVTIHLDLYGRPHERSITVAGEQGTLRWSYEDNSLAQSDKNAQEWETEVFTCERNEMFVNAARHFMDLLHTGTTPACTIEDGHAVLRLVEAMRCSAAERRTVEIEADAA